MVVPPYFSIISYVYPYGIWPCEALHPATQAFLCESSSPLGCSGEPVCCTALLSQIAPLWYPPIRSAAWLEGEWTSLYAISAEDIVYKLVLVLSIP